MKTLKKPLSLLMALFMCLGMFAGTGVTAFAAGETMTTYILYGGVFVKETKAPEGFLLDENAYYVEIAEHGKIYEV